MSLGIGVLLQRCGQPAAGDRHSSASTNEPIAGRIDLEIWIVGSIFLTPLRQGKEVLYEYICGEFAFWGK
jgi:hypothetical protein